MGQPSLKGKGSVFALRLFYRVSVGSSVGITFSFTADQQWTLAQAIFIYLHRF